MDAKIGKILTEGAAKGFVAYKSVHGQLFPWLFTRENIAELEPWRQNSARYPVLKMLLAVSRKDPEGTYGVLVRGCEERGLIELFKWNQLGPDRVIVVGQACSAELAAYCECAKPFPDRLDFGQPVEGVQESRRVAEISSMPEGDRLQNWLSHFNRCIRCHGCRDVCPVCFCTECSLQHPDLIPGQKLPPDTSFHMVRAAHMAGRCIDCGLCEEVCPARIPLRPIYKEVNRVVAEIFDYRPGFDNENKSPFSFLGEDFLLPPGPR